MRTHWYASLYWRIAFGFVACVAAILVVQAVLFVWVVSRTGPTLPGQAPDRFAQSIALDLAEELERSPTADLGRFVREQVGRNAHPFLVLLADGRVFQNGGPFPEGLLRVARARLQRRLDRDRAEREGTPPPERGSYRNQEPGSRRSNPSLGSEGQPGRSRSALEAIVEPSFRPMRPVPILVNGVLTGIVVVLPQAPFPFLLQRYAPTLALVALGALIVGAVLATVVIFGPPRRRLKAVEEAARRLGNGDLTARAPASGSDEVAAVATAFNAMADDLSARAAALAASDRARRNLLLDVSHELTTPITAMRGYLETLTMPDFSLDEATRSRYLGIIGDETARLEHIVGDLLDLARMEGGGDSVEMDDVPTEELFSRVRARHERACQESGVTMTASIEPGADLILGDQARLEQALQNLAANAVRYAPRGSTVDLLARSVGDGVVLSVTDRGRGIAPEHLPHVFDRFFKAEASRAQPAGTKSGSGLGLSIVKAILERHGGRVSVTSVPGQTVFEIAGLQKGSSEVSPHAGS
jgi:signal transduction histidine kinase